MKWLADWWRRHIYDPAWAEPTLHRWDEPDPMETVPYYAADGERVLTDTEHAALLASVGLTEDA